MSLRINNNIAASRSLRALQENDQKLTRSLERLSTGFRINRASDSPSGLVVSEQLRGQIAGLNQAIANSETATTIVQTTEGALTEINNLLIRMRGLALDAANTGGNDQNAVEADQLEIQNALDAIQRTSNLARFGTKKLLDGSTGITGEAQGMGLSFVAGTEQTKTSPIQGYMVEVEQVATRARMEGSTALEDENVRGLSITVSEGGRTAQVRGSDMDTALSFFGKLRDAVENAGMALNVRLRSNGELLLEHQDYGTAATFSASSSVGGILSEDANVVQAAVPGQDIKGTIGGEAALGKGQTLTGVNGNEDTEGLVVRYAAPRVLVEEAGLDGRPLYAEEAITGMVGSVSVANNALAFQVGPNPEQSISIALPATAPRFLGRQVDNDSSFNSLADISVRTVQGANDSIALIDSAINELTLARGRLGAFQRNNLEKNIATLRVTAENLTAAESNIRDANVAEELAEFTRNRIMFEASAAMLAQSNLPPRTIIELIK